MRNKNFQILEIGTFWSLLVKFILETVISSTDLKGHVGYCHHLASVVGVGTVMVLVVIHKLLHFNLLFWNQTW
jgi:hypothetical protein